MRITIDTKTNQPIVETDGSARILDLCGKEAFEILSDWGLKKGVLRCDNLSPCF